MLCRFLEALDEPALLLARSGVIRHANAATLRLLGCRGTAPLVGRPLSELVVDPPEAVASLVRRLFATGASVIGSLQLRATDGSIRKYQCRGCRVSGLSEADGIFSLLRLENTSQERFRVLTQKIVALNAEIRRNKLIQIQLEATLEQREILLRELHHRVKNNLQTLLGMLSLAEQRTTLPKAREVIGDAKSRVEALAVLQRLLYQNENLGSVDGPVFLREVCANVERAFRRPGIAVRVSSAELSMGLDVASVVALIVNELLTNAFKHAFPASAEGEILIRLGQEDSPGGTLVLVVEDNGRGLGARHTPGTGMALVRGLAQQQGGTCSVESRSGVRCVVTLRDGQTSRPRPALQ
jgi:two-component sensor histidine kinase